MYRIAVVISIICIIPSSSQHLTISDDDHRLLPPIYAMENYPECVREKNMYCVVDIKLDSLHRNSDTWRLIEETRADTLLFNHDTIHRAICVPKIYGNRSQEIEHFTTSHVSEEIGKLNLTATIDNISCHQQTNTTATDNIYLCLVVTYYLLVFSATLYDLRIRKKNGAVKGNQILTAFSLRSNYDKIFIKSTGKNKLKCIEGVRTLSNILVICTHTKLSYGLSFVDAKNLENIYKFLRTFFIFDMFVIQIFLLISAWLLTIQVLDIFEANRKFTVKDAFLLVVNRCFRFWPALLFAVILQRRVFMEIVLDTPLDEIFDAMISACDNYWWASLLFVHNHLKVKDMCYGVTWYMSNDMQLYIISLVILYSVLKFKSTKRILGLCLFMSYTLFGFTIYINNLGVVFRVTPESWKWRNFLNDPTFVSIYTATHVNAVTYILGICFGTFYHSHQHSQMFNKKIFRLLWNLSFFVLPALAVAIASSGEFEEGLTAAFVGPLLKIMFSLGIGMGILGMSLSTGGILKKIFEWRPLQFLAQFTFCSYVYHYMVVFLRVLVMQTPLALSTGILITSFIQDATCGIAIGFVMHLLVELPWRNIQKLYVPQVKKRATKSD